MRVHKHACPKCPKFGVCFELDSCTKKWTLWNSFITKVDYGQLQYEGGEGLVEISLDLAYDWARVEIVGANKGSAATVGEKGKTFFDG